MLYCWWGQWAFQFFKLTMPKMWTFENTEIIDYSCQDSSQCWTFFFTLSVLRFNTCCVCGILCQNKYGTSKGTKEGGKAALFRREWMPPNSRGPAFSPPLLWSHTRHFISRNHSFPTYIGNNVFKSVKCRRNCISIECNCNDVLFVRWGGSLLFQVCYVINIGFYLGASLKDSIEYVILHFMSWDFFLLLLLLKDKR